MNTGLKPIDFLFGFGVVITWGMGLVFAKAAIGHFPPVFLMSLRFFLTALVLVWFVRPPLGQMGKLFRSPSWQRQSSIHSLSPGSSRWIPP